MQEVPLPLSLISLDNQTIPPNRDDESLATEYIDLAHSPIPSHHIYPPPFMNSHGLNTSSGVLKARNRSLGGCFEVVGNGCQRSNFWAPKHWEIDIAR